MTCICASQRQWSRFHDNSFTLALTHTDWLVMAAWQQNEIIHRLKSIRKCAVNASSPHRTLRVSYFINVSTLHDLVYPGGKYPENHVCHLGSVSLPLDCLCLSLCIASDDNLNLYLSTFSFTHLWRKRWTWARLSLSHNDAWHVCVLIEYLRFFHPVIIYLLHAILSAKCKFELWTYSNRKKSTRFPVYMTRIWEVEAIFPLFWANIPEIHEPLSQIHLHNN